MEFKAIVPDLTLELTTLTGEQLILDPPKPVNGKVAKEIMSKFVETKEDDAEEMAVDIIVNQLAYIYPKPAEWFLENFDLSTLGQILKHVAETIGNIKKKSTS